MKTYNFTPGQKINKLTLIRKFKTDKHAMWECICDCGNIVDKKQQDLGVDRAYSCGCERRWKKYGNQHPFFTGHEEIYGNFYSNIKRKAIQAGHKWEVTIEQLWELFLKQNRLCMLTGLELTFGNSIQRSLGTASLDRINSNKEYTIDNVQWVHKMINNMKWDFTQNYFITLCKAIADYN